MVGVRWKSAFGVGIRLPTVCLTTSHSKVSTCGEHENFFFWSRTLGVV